MIAIDCMLGMALLFAVYAVLRANRLAERVDKLEARLAKEKRSAQAGDNIREFRPATPKD